MAHKHAIEQQEEEEREQEAIVRPGMLKRLSTIHPSPTKDELVIKQSLHHDDRGDRHDMSVKQLNSIDLTNSIDQQFSILTSPTAPLKGTKHNAKPIEEPKILRVPRGKQTFIRKSLSTESSSEEDTVIIMAPLQINKLSTHDGQIYHQPLEDASEVIVGDRSEMLVPKGRLRPSIESFWDSPTDDEPVTTPIQSRSRGSSSSPSELLSLRVRTLLLNNNNECN